VNIHVSESAYPLNFRQEAASELSKHLLHRHSVELVGMKRVGINNFLRFFIFHKGIKSHYLPQKGKSFFIFVDLIDLIEREIFPFWRLSFKRIVDSVSESSIDQGIKDHISTLFEDCIQSGDLFLTFDGIRETLVILTQANIFPTIFFNRFDRIKDAVTPEFFDNLQGLQNITNHKLSYVFTSYRELDTLTPKVFHKKIVSVFLQVMYLKPSDESDSRILFNTALQRYNFVLQEKLKNEILRLCGGHVQYLQISAVILHELGESVKNTTPSQLFSLIAGDERTILQSEELWESLGSLEQEALQKINSGISINKEEKEKAKYLWDTGFVRDGSAGSPQVSGKTELFSDLFGQFVKDIQAAKKDENKSYDLSKKEHILFVLLQQYPNEICEREVIVEKVWPEYKEYGVSDWSIDRLVARLRGKLRKQKSMYEISTVRTRGYRLTTR